MKERPILMCGEMVRATLEGRKTHTRRAMTNKYHDIAVALDVLDDAETLKWAATFCPYGQPGDRLWVKETFHEYAYGDPREPDGIKRNQVVYKADEEDWDVKWRPSIFMPRWASRILLEITDIRVERLQDISEDGAIAEGVTPDPIVYGDCCYTDAFIRIIKSLNDKRPGCSWDDNPWIWVIEFKKVGGAYD